MLLWSGGYSAATYFAKIVNCCGATTTAAEPAGWARVDRRANLAIANGTGLACGTLDRSPTQHYRCVVLPTFDAIGNLPPGIHWTEWHHVEQRFGMTPHRRRLLKGLLRALQNLRGAGCSVVYLDGSFVTAR